MATNVETTWVTDAAQLQNTVQQLIARGGVVQQQSDTEVTLFIKKKINIVVLIVGLLLCLVPGIAYAVWYATADQSQQMTVKIGSPASINTQHEHWYNEEAVDGASPGTVPPEVPAAPAQPAIGETPAAPAAPPPAAAPPPVPPPAAPQPAPPPAPGTDPGAPPAPPVA